MYVLFELLTKKIELKSLLICRKLSSHFKKSNMLLSIEIDEITFWWTISFEKKTFRLFLYPHPIYPFPSVSIFSRFFFVGTNITNISFSTPRRNIFFVQILTKAWFSAGFFVKIFDFYMSMSYIDMFHHERCKNKAFAERYCNRWLLRYS